MLPAMRAQAAADAVSVPETRLGAAAAPPTHGGPAEKASRRNPILGCGAPAADLPRGLVASASRPNCVSDPCVFSVLSLRRVPPWEEMALLAITA